MVAATEIIPPFTRGVNREGFAWVDLSGAGRNAEASFETSPKHKFDR